MFGQSLARQHDRFRADFQSHYGFAPPEAMVQWLFLPRAEQDEAFAATGFRPYTPEQVLADRSRWPAMPPGFIPFADEGGGDAAGLYYPWRLTDGRIPVVYFLHETGHLYPLTADVAGFILRQLLLQPLVDWPDSAPRDAREKRAVAARATRWAKLFDIPAQLPEVASAWEQWTDPGCLYGSTTRYRHELITHFSGPAPASELWLAQQQLTLAGPAADILDRLETLLAAFPELGGAHLLRARLASLQGSPEVAAASYVAALQCPIALFGHTPGDGGPHGSEPLLPEGPDGEVAAFIATCSHVPEHIAANPSVRLAVELTQQWQRWFEAIGTADADRLRPSNADHAAARRTLAEAAWQAGHGRTAINQMLNVLFLTWYESDEGWGALTTLADWYAQLGDTVTAQHAARLLG